MDYEDHLVKEAQNQTEKSFYDSVLYRYFIPQEIILTLIGIIAIGTNILFIYIVCCYKKLHTNTNIYLVNWAISDTGVLLVIISTFGIFDPILDLPETILCFYFGLASNLFFTTVFFMLTVTIDWWFSAYLPRASDKFKEYTKVVTAVMWIVAGTFSIMSTFLCSTDNYYIIYHITTLVVFGILIALVKILHCVRLVKRCRGQLEYHPVSLLYIPTVFVFCWSLSWFDAWFADVAIEYYVLLDLPYFLHPLINFILIVFLDENFKACIVKLLPCKAIKMKFQQLSERSASVEA